MLSIYRFGYDDPDYSRIMDFTMHDVIIGSAKQECVKKRAKYVLYISDHGFI